jgi:hypothetical protein
VKDPAEPFQRPTRAAFERLAARFREGKLLVATTRRLLGFCRAMRAVTVAAQQENEWTHFAMASNGVPKKDLSGLTIYCDNPQKATVRVDGNNVSVLANAADETGRKSVSIAWDKLSYPAIAALT